ncbi:hypothetical protein Y1Q_0023445 [Alligator mississippiensis]|uniref:Uncharacterized protein n=1 Tax=Alligator mississippiensis TaxID=8496 RepID=A0A151NPN9_ALLMI|nr:hypothetical protein Y1Q_0023445 [Alligator mississippiensis]
MESLTARKSLLSLLAKITSLSCSLELSKGCQASSEGPVDLLACPGDCNIYHDCKLVRFSSCLTTDFVGRSRL